MDNGLHKYFTKQLMRWHETDNHRTMPWKEEKDPYKIWLSEIILQQTRTEQGMPYYLNFIQYYPTIKHLASANDEEVFKLWQGLGYYNRCRNLLATARLVTQEMNGHFPDTYDSILQLKGIGPYTASAIASFAFGLPYAVVDGNVYRVLSRYFGIDTPIDSTAGKKQFAELANLLLYKKDSAAYNQAIMDFGATVCKPSSPDCDSCPLQKKCVAYTHSLISDLPVKSKKLKVKERYFHYVFLIHQDTVWIHKRTDKDIWQNLHEPYLIEHNTTMNKTEIKKTLNKQGIHTKQLQSIGHTSQRLTHRIIHSYYYSAHLTSKTALPSDGVWVNKTDLDKYAFPKSLISFVEKKSYF